MNKIHDFQRQRRQAHVQLVALKSKVYAAFLQMESVTYSDGALPRRTKELIAVGISVVMDCESCMEWHITQAAGCGASRLEVLEAVEVGIEMAGGRATVSARFALEAMDEVFGPAEKEGPP